MRKLSYAFFVLIIGGTEVEDTSPIRSFTVGLYDSSNHSKCTGTLITENVILTAAHCVSSVSKLSIVFSTNFNAAKIPVTDLKRHELYDPSKQDGADKVTHDLALVKFNTPLPKGYAPIVLNSEERNVVNPTSEFLAAGFGVTNSLGTGSGTLRQVKIKFKQIHSETEIQTEQGSKGVCSGDSGGPLLFQDSSGHFVLVGVASRVATKFLGCRGFAVFTRVDKYQDWIQEKILELSNPK